jgi:hypothetical protein
MYSISICFFWPFTNRHLSETAWLHSETNASSLHELGLWTWRWENVWWIRGRYWCPFMDLDSSLFRKLPVFTPKRSRAHQWYRFDNRAGVSVTISNSNCTWLQFWCKSRIPKSKDYGRLAECTVRWSNFDLRDPKWGFSCKVQRRPPADILLNESLPPNPPLPRRHHVQGRHGHGSPVKNRWRFLKFRKKYETLTLTLKICTLQENGFEELTLVLFESLF